MNAPGYVSQSPSTGFGTQVNGTMPTLRSRALDQARRLNSLVVQLTTLAGELGVVFPPAAVTGQTREAASSLDASLTDCCCSISDLEGVCARMTEHIGTK